MTTALITTQRVQVGKARVAWVSHRAGALVQAFHRRNDELVEFPDWPSLAAGALGTRFDLVLCDEQVSASIPANLGVPAFVVAEEPVSSTTIPTILRANLEGALDAVVGLALALSAATSECASLQHVVDGIRTGDALVGTTPVMRRLQGAIRRAADCEVTVLLEGATGSGKSLVARIIHCKSRRAGRPFVTLSGAAMTADSLSKGLDAARATTVILEDVDRLPPAAQALLVRSLKERSSQTQAARLIVTTSAHLPELVARGAFREDLYYRLHAFPLVVPSLKERAEDLHAIARTLVEAGAAGNARSACGLTPSALMLLDSMQWPGNVAQLESVLRRAHVAAGGGIIDKEHLLTTPAEPATSIVAQAQSTAAAESEDSIRPFEEEEKLLLSRALRATKGNVRRAAQLLNIGRATLYRKIQQYHLRLQ